MKKILFIAHDDLSGGSAKALLEQMFFLLQQKMYIPIVIVFSKNSLYYALKKMGIEAYSVRFGFNAIWNTFRLLLPLKWLVYNSFFNRIALWFLRNKIDISSISLIVSNSSIINLGLYIHRKTQIPHVCFLREYGDDLVPLVKNVGKKINEDSNVCVAVSQAVAQCWINKGINGSKIKVVYDGVCIPPNSEKKERTNSSIRICICGRISKFKGQIFAIKSLLLLSDSVKKNVILDIYGKGPSLYGLKWYVKKMHLDKNVNFKGFSNNLVEELYQYDIGMNLTEKEGFGRTTVEYLMHGLFVVGCNSGATPELLCAGKYGALVEYGNANQIACVIESFYKNRIANKKQSNLAKLYAMENFDSSKCLKKIFQVYADSLK